MEKIGIVDTMFSKFNMGSLAIKTIKDSGKRVEVIRVTVPGIKDLAVASKKLIEEKVITDIHSIIHWIDKKNPNGQIPERPEIDSQYNLWEEPVKIWVENQGIQKETINDIPKEYDDIHKPEYNPKITLIKPQQNTLFSSNSVVDLEVNIKSNFDIEQIDILFKNSYLGSISNTPYKFSINLSEIENLKQKEDIIIKAYDKVGNSSSLIIPLNISL